jgi:hypothetical protein
MGTPPERARQRRVVAGTTLALIGLALFWLNITEGPSHAIIMAAIGAAFLAAYYAGQGYGLLIPACILLGLGLGELAEEVWWGDFNQLGLGLGFIAIYVIDRLRRGETSWWPLVPGGIITVSALGAEFGTVRAAVEKGWPLILVVIGVALIAGVGKSRRRNHDDTPDPRGPHVT